MRRTILMTSLLLGAIPVAACGEEDPKVRADEPGSSLGGGGGAPGRFVDDGEMVRCGNSSECPDPSQQCRKEAGERVGVCIECQTDDQCASGETCSNGQCGGGVCRPGLLTCIDNDFFATCNADGTGFLSPQVCESGSCALVEGKVTCDEASGTGGRPNDDPGTGGSAPTTGSNLIDNGDFSDGSSGWEGGTGAPPIKDGKACVSWSATVGWQGSGQGVNLEPGSYTLGFSAVGSGVEVEVKLGLVNYPYEPVLLTKTLTLETKSYSFDFNVSALEASMGLAFNVSSEGSEICLDDVTLRKN